jgi:hypothetical protein
MDILIGIGVAVALIVVVLGNAIRIVPSTSEG